MSVRALGSLGLAIALGWAVPARAAIEVPDPACGTWPVVVRGGAVIYPLPVTFLRAGTERVRVRDRELMRDRDFVIDRTRGVLRLLVAPVAGETLWVSACRLLDPPMLERRRYEYRRSIAPDRAAGDTARGPLAATPRPVTSRIPSEAPLGSELTLAGSKTLAVEFGSNQDAFLKQSLDLTVSGTLAPGVEVSGILTDRSAALGAGGASEELRSLDRLLLKVRSPGAEAELGDITVRVERGPFLRMERRLQGVSGRVQRGGLEGSLAAASAEGEYRRVEFFGIEGRQGPYVLTNASGEAAIGIVTGSEAVTLDGERLTRGESADYSIDYERGEITFTNHRPVSSSSRVSVEYQFDLDRFRRNVTVASSGWATGPWRLGASYASEGDDRGRPIAGALAVEDRLVLSGAGDSVERAIGSGVTAGGGDYDLVQSPGGPYYAFVAPDSGDFDVRFVFVGSGRGDYLDSASVAGRTTFRYAGAAAGTHAIGRSLPLPTTHHVMSLGGGYQRGAVTLAIDGALSELDRNSFSSLDDRDNAGGALEGRMNYERHSATRLSGAGFGARIRAVERRFAPFDRLERAYAEEGWGVPVGDDLDHQRTAEVSGFVRDPRAGEWRASVSGLRTPNRYSAVRHALSWSRSGALNARALWDRAEGRAEDRTFERGGRDLRSADLSLVSRWLEPAVRVLWDERRSPSDSTENAARSRELAGELKAPSRFAWRARLAGSIRREAYVQAATFDDRTEARTLGARLESAPAPITLALEGQRRDYRTLASGERVRSDLASLLLRGTRPTAGLSGQAGVEVTSEGQSVRLRQVQFVGAGNGAYDSLGNLVGAGSYDLVLVTGAELERVGRAATSARLAWQAPSDRFAGSRLELVFESEARRRGTLNVLDLAVPPRRALGDADLVRGAITQRLEFEGAPSSPRAAVRVRLERRVSADRSFDNFAQTRDDRSASARWRGRPGAAWTAELEGRAVRQAASQAFAGAAPFRRTLEEIGLTTQLAFSSSTRLRAVGVGDLAWTRSAGATERTRVVRVGPDLGLAVGRAGRVDVSARRAFFSGPAPLSLVPSIDPAGPPRWDATLRVDYRVLESSTVGISWALQDRPGRDLLQTGRAEVRAYF
ncbi:MAG: hypothetical protein HOP12_05920 [Candidatus Eisenbacteria bacterium]|uniref:Uncharacterized protein n=1 Tax=Eiseniibacteriota bacterium TaxID=2212470 RepID=A0A849SM68_UNCEI|nr:hypothetical protein [Candidatus Eisenbacteria bacterium]